MHLKAIAAAAGSAIAVVGCTSGGSLPPTEATQSKRADAAITIVPKRTSKTCRSGRAKLYDECSDQLRLLAKARETARAQNKLVLVSYGAEWCIWCHVFAEYVHGQSGAFTYTYGRPDAPDARMTSTLHERAERDVLKDAEKLSRFVADNFVLVHIDAQYAPNGKTVLAKTAALAHSGHSIPFVFSLRHDGRYAAHLVSSRVEVRRDTVDWYRGYDRAKLLAELKRLHAAGKTSS